MQVREDVLHRNFMEKSSLQIKTELVYFTVLQAVK